MVKSSTLYLVIPSRQTMKKYRRIWDDKRPLLIYRGRRLPYGPEISRAMIAHPDIRKGNNAELEFTWKRDVDPIFHDRKNMLEICGHIAEADWSFLHEHLSPRWEWRWVTEEDRGRI